MKSALESYKQTIQKQLLTSGLYNNMVMSDLHEIVEGIATRFHGEVEEEISRRKKGIAKSIQQTANELRQS